jgi:hypothetical protein
MWLTLLTGFVCGAIVTASLMLAWLRPERDGEEEVTAAPRGTWAGRAKVPAARRKETPRAACTPVEGRARRSPELEEVRVELLGRSVAGGALH